MKHALQKILLVIGLGALASLAFANEAASIKMGVIDWQKLITSAPQAKEAGKRLEKEFQEPTEKLKNKQKEFETKRDKLQRDRDILSAADRTKRERELAKLGQELRRLDEEYRGETTTRQMEERDNFLKLVREVVEKMAIEEKLDAVFSYEVVVYYSDRVDITDQVFEKLESMAKSGKKS